MSEMYVDLNPVLRDIGGLAHAVANVELHLRDVEVIVNDVAQEQTHAQQRLEELFEQFVAFLDRSEWTNEVSAARQELQLARSEIEKKYGHYEQVRRHATGILQATDVAVIRQETVHSAAEELMLASPRYWLAPALVALSGWIADNRALAERALAEALRRDDSKVSLFFALVAQRARRTHASTKWLARYFLQQNPATMDREVVVMLDALASGVFGGAALNACSDVVEEWLTRLEAQPGFADAQRERWAAVLDKLTPKQTAEGYPTLRQYSTTWPRLRAALGSARRNQVVLGFFQKIFAGEIVVPPKLQSTVDDVLTRLISQYDDEELPLRRKERWNALIVEADMLACRASQKRAHADRRFRAETSVLEQQTSFAAILTTLAMHPDQYGASKAAQRYSLSCSRQWLLAGYNDLTARDRAKVPVEAELRCGSWVGKSRDGGNQHDLIADLSGHYRQRTREAQKTLKVDGNIWAILGGGIVAALWIMSTGLQGLGIGALLVLGTVGYTVLQFMKVKKARDDVEQVLTTELDDATVILKAALAELADVRREIVREDGKSKLVCEFLSALNSTEFIQRRPDSPRSIAA